MILFTYGLVTEAGISHNEALLVLKAALPGGDQGSLQGAVSAKNLLEKEQHSKHIITFSSELDKILGGGIHTGQITEFCGVPGVGKTQLGMQLSINAQIPVEFSGIEGESIYIDSEGSFSAERCRQMAESFCKHLKKVAIARQDEQKMKKATTLSAEDILKRIHYFRVRDAVEQLAVIEILGTFLTEHPQVKLVVVDSVAFHFRQDFDDLAARTRRLSQMAQHLMALAHKFDIAIVMMNQVTTRILGDGQSRLVPALGDSWAHAATNRVLCYWKGSDRFAFLFKSPSMPAAAAEYRVSKDGIRSVRSNAAVKRKLG